MDQIFLLELFLLLTIVVFQFVAFTKTASKIGSFKTLFPEPEDISILQNGGLTKIEVQVADGDVHPAFLSIRSKINKFLSKTRGSIEGSNVVFTNIIKREKSRAEDEIESQLSAPLYLGLAGTLLGIVFGLFHLMSATGSADFSDLSNEAINGLFKSVAVAIVVSLIGLVLVIINTNFIYKRAKVKTDSNEADLLSKIEIELVPNVAESTASAIYSLREHLTQFNKEFSRNLDNYKDNFSLMNDNLKTQEQILKLLEKSNLAETAKELAVVLKDIEGVSNNFKIFKDYQQELISSFGETKEITQQYNQTLQSYEGFNTKLDQLTDSIESNTAFNTEFRKFLSNNFPNDKSALEIYDSQWREVGKRLIKDIAENSVRITNYFDSVNREIGSFSENNQTFFDSFSGTKQVIEVLIKNSEMSHKAFEITQKNMKQLSQEIVAQNTTIQELTEAVQGKVL